MLHLPSKAGSHYTFSQDVKISSYSILDEKPPVELVDLALQTLQSAQVRVMEWRSLLYRRMNVPNLVKDFSYAVPDDDFEEASAILERIGLPLSPPSKLLRKVYGDLCDRGRFHRITKSTLTSSVQNIVIYPLSFTTITFNELQYEQPAHMQPSKCGKVLVPHQSAVYASLIRMIVRCPQYSRIRTSLQSELSELIGYNLLRLDNGYVDPDDNNMELGIADRIANAILHVRQWSWNREWREGEEWIGDTLAAIIEGCDINNLPYTS